MSTSLTSREECRLFCLRGLTNLSFTCKNFHCLCIHSASLMMHFILKGRGLTGLKNLGNSCYMNSIIQCINNTTPLVFYFCEGVYREDVNHHNNSTQGEVAEEVAAVVRALWSGQYRSIACRDLKSVVGQHRKQFQGYEQQDSHEFLTILMDWLHEDLNKV